MTKLDEFIQELCPDGVKYLPIPELFITRNGYTPSKANNEFWENGTIPWFRMEDIRENGRILTTATQYVSEKAVKGKLFPADSIIIATSATIGEHALIKVPSLANQRFTYLTLKDEFKDCVDMMFVFYYCFRFDEYCKSHLNQGNFASVDMKQFAAFKFPLPPLPVQREIVRILDNLAELTEELTAELTARKQQYAYYRDKLLTFENFTEWRTLDDVIVSLNTGLNPRQFFKLNTDDAHNYYVTIREIQNGTIVVSDKTDRINDDALRLCNNRSNLEVGDVLFSGTGTIGETAVISEPPTNWNIKEGIYVIKPRKEVLHSHYLMYILRTDALRSAIFKKVAGGTVKSIPMAEMRNLRVPVPSLKIQKRLVEVLDNFDAICTDLSSGLPAEIEARQKQYEYYRNKLLDFEQRGDYVNVEEKIKKQEQSGQGAAYDSVCNSSRRNVTGRNAAHNCERNH